MRCPYRSRKERRVTAAVVRLPLPRFHGSPAPSDRRRPPRCPCSSRPLPLPLHRHHHHSTIVPSSRRARAPPAPPAPPVPVCRFP